MVPRTAAKAGKKYAVINRESNRLLSDPSAEKSTTRYSLAQRTVIHSTGHTQEIHVTASADRRLPERVGPSQLY